MAATPLFGGTNQVTELDAGQRGSARYIANLVLWIVSTREGPPELSDVVAKIPEQNQAFMHRSGFSGRIITWSGLCVIKNAAELGSLRSVMSQYTTGSTLDGLQGGNTGKRGAPDVTFFRPTVLEDSFGGRLADRAVMVNWQFTGTMRGSNRSGFSYTTGMQAVFRIL